MSRSEKTAPSDEQVVQTLNREIEQTRGQLSATIGVLEQRLSPSELGEKAKVELEHLEVRVRGLLKESLDDAKVALDEKLEAAKGAVHEEILEAKGAVKEQLHEAKALVTQGLSEARAAIKEDVHTAIVTTKESVRAATLGRLESGATQVGDFMNSSRDTLVETVRQNPIPAALAGIGIAWLLMNRSSAARDRARGSAGPQVQGEYGYAYGPGYPDRGMVGNSGPLSSRSEPGAQHGLMTDAAGSVLGKVGDALTSAAGAVSTVAHDTTEAASHAVGAAGRAVHGATDQAGRMVHQATDATGRVIHGATEAVNHFAHDAAGAASQLAMNAQHVAGDLAHGARDQARRLEHTLESTLQSNPLAVGAAVLVVGAAVGYALPRTKKEDVLMGEFRDRMLGQATHLAEDLTHSLQHVAGDAGASVKRALGEPAEK